MNFTFLSLRAPFLTLLLLPFSASDAEEFPPFPPFGITEPIAPLVGSLVLSGSEKPTDLARKAMAQLAGGKAGSLVLISEETDKDEVARWADFADSVASYEIKATDEGVSPEVIAAIRRAHGVWLGGDFSRLKDAELQRALVELLERDGVVGGGGSGAQSLGELVVVEDEPLAAFGLLPQSVVKAGAEDGLAQPASPSHVIWQIPATGTLVVHSGREVGVIGETEITARIPAQNGWPERLEVLRPPEVRLPYSADLFSWTRSAQARSGPLFPPAEPVSPEVAAGSLIIIGGGGTTEDMWTRFIEDAGGTEANYVCIIQQESSFPEQNLRKLGCENVTVLLSDIDLREKANSDAEFLSALKEADGIFFGGGRTFRFMDTYQNTTAHRLMLDVLARGGVIAGTSAGAQIQGDFLVRGDPRTNRNLWSEGNDVGLSFLRGVIIDVHFLNRGRQKTLPALLRKHPKMLGIGIDEATAIIVEGTTAEVLGRGTVSFYDLADDEPSTEPNPKVLKAGACYDLKSRELIAKP